jgi:hypothetical protein
VKKLLSLEQSVESKSLSTHAVDRISYTCWTTYKSLLHCSSVGRNLIFLTLSSFCLLDASNHTSKPQTSPPYYFWWRIQALLVSNMYHSLLQKSYFFCPLFLNYFKQKYLPLIMVKQTVLETKTFTPHQVKQLVLIPKISTSSHGQAVSIPTKNIFLFSRSSS